MMVRARKPKRVFDFNEICASLIIGCGFVIALSFLLISGIDIVVNYWSVLSGVLLSPIAQEQMTYSIEVFVGTGLLLIVYSYDAVKIIRRLFRLKDVEHIKTTT